MIRRLLRALHQARRPAPPDGGPYRHASDESPRQVLLEIQATMRAQAIRIRVLERQLEAKGITPASTPLGLDLLTVAEILDALAQGTILSKFNTLQYRVLAELVRGLADWIDDEPP